MSVVSVLEEGYCVFTHWGPVGWWQPANSRLFLAGATCCHSLGVSLKGLLPLSATLAGSTCTAHTHKRKFYDYLDANKEATFTFDIFDHWHKGVQIYIFGQSCTSLGIWQFACLMQRSQTHGGISPTKGTERGDGGARLGVRVLRRDLSLSTTSFNICSWPGSNVRQDGTLSCRLVKEKKIDVALKR